MYLNYFQLIIGSVCLIIIGFCISKISQFGFFNLWNRTKLTIGGVCLAIIGFCMGRIPQFNFINFSFQNLEALIPFQPLVVGMLAIGGACIAYLGTLKMSQTHIQISEENYRKEENKSLNEKTEAQKHMSLKAQFATLQIMGFMLAWYSSRMDRTSNFNPQFEVLKLNELSITIEKYLPTITKNLNKFLKFNADISFQMHKLFFIWEDIKANIEFMHKNFNTLPIEEIREGVLHAYSVIGVTLNNNINRDNIIIKLSHFSGAKLLNSDQYKVFSSEARELEKSFDEDEKIFNQKVLRANNLEL